MLSTAAARTRAARRAWAVLMPLAIGLFVLAVPYRFADLEAIARAQGPIAETHGLGWLTAPGVYGATVLALEILFVGSFIITSAAIAWAHSTDWRNYYFSAVFVAYGTWVTPTMDALSMDGATGRVVSLTQAAGLYLAISFFLLFPDGRFVPRWSRFSALAWGIYCIAWGLWPEAWFSLVDPFVAGVVPFVALMTGWCTGLYAQGLRYSKDADTRQRRQTRWVIMAVGAAGICYGTIYTVDALIPDAGAARVIYDLIGVPTFWLLALPIPVALAGAMIRYSLFDFPRVLRGTLLYGSLTAVLAATYFVMILTVQGLTPIGRNSPLLVAGSTLVVVSLFRPLKDRLQTSIDRRFYRSKYDAARVVDAFGTRLRLHTNIDELSQELLEVVEETMKPQTRSLWLRSGERALSPE